MHYLWIIVMFLSAVWSLILTAPIHSCRSNYKKKDNLQICSDEETNSSTSWMAWLHFANFYFWVNYPFNYDTCLSASSGINLNGSCSVGMSDLKSAIFALVLRSKQLMLNSLKG